MNVSVKPDVQEVLWRAARRRNLYLGLITAGVLLAFAVIVWGQWQAREAQIRGRETLLAVQDVASSLNECNTPSQPNDLHECFVNARERSAQERAHVAKIGRQDRRMIVCILLVEPENRSRQKFRACVRRAR